MTDPRMSAAERRQLVADALDESQEVLTGLLDAQARLPRLIERVRAVRDSLEAALATPPA